MSTITHEIETTDNAVNDTIELRLYEDDVRELLARYVKEHSGLDVDPDKLAVLMDGNNEIMVQAVVESHKRL